MLMFFLAAILVVGVSGGRSPNADFVDEIAGLQAGARYSNDILEDAKLDVPGLVRKYGYPIESHGVITEDGYALTMHRIPHGRDRHNRPDSRKPVVFVMHGLMSSSADFLVLGPGNALGYYLAEEGYDVWMGNARGNYYSRRHRTLNPDSKLNQAFWKFSWDEIGNYDLPAFIDYITRVTGQQKLHYIGHSQGGTAFLVLNSLRPEYNNKFISFQGLAPASFFTHNQHSVFTNIAHLETVLETAAFAMGMGEVFGNRDFITWFATNWCVDGSIFQPICNSVMIRGSSDYFNATMIPLFLGHSPAGASIRQFAHYGQSIRHDTFRRFYHNPITNLATYGRVNPPSYDLSRITVPAYIHYATNDELVHPDDIKILASKLPNLVGTYLVDSETFDHIDFVWGNGVKSKVYVKVLRMMRDAERRYH